MKNRKEQIFTIPSEPIQCIYGPPEWFKRTEKNSCYNCAYYAYDIITDENICTNMASPYFCELAETGKCCEEYCIKGESK